MALIGKLINYDNHTDEFIEQEVTLEYPADLAEDHPDYDKRGTTEVVIGKTEVITEKTYDNVYVNINQVTVNRMFMTNEEGNDSPLIFKKLQLTLEFLNGNSDILLLLL